MTAERTKLAFFRHELRTPLNHIIGYGEMLLEDVEGSHRSDFESPLRSILTDAHQLLRLVNDFLSPQAISAESVDIKHVPPEFIAPLNQIITTSASLKKLAVETGAKDLLSDMERMLTAEGYLSDLVTHGVRALLPESNAAVAVSGTAAAPADAFGRSPNHGAILVVDDNEETRDMLSRRLAREGYTNVVTAADGEEAIELMRSRKFDLVLLDVIMPGLDGFAVCERLREQDATRDVPIIFLTALDDTFDKVRAFSAGAVDYVTKPFQPQELLARVGTHLSLLQARRALQEQNARLRDEIEAHHRSKATIECLIDEIQSNHNFCEIIGASPALTRLLGEVELVAPTNSTVLILGETGTGKELVARAIHRRSPRRGRPLIKINCAALPRDLVESELFGHEKGAFTGATQQRRGRFELADGGTLFLDEIAELPLEAQGKLLRVLQDQEFERVGGTRSLHTDVRVIAATNRDLRPRLKSGAFRADLYYRLNVFPLTLPPLRERREDIPHLVRYFTERAARKVGKHFDDIAQAFLDQSMIHDWPGNVRELENAVERAAILSGGATLEAKGGFNGPDGAASTPAATRIAHSSLDDMERTHIVRVLEQTRWVIEGEQGAARVLGLNASTLRGRMRKFGIQKNA